MGGVWSYYTVLQIKGIYSAGHFAFEVGDNECNDFIGNGACEKFK
jgi:hypothetical protein